MASSITTIVSMGYSQVAPPSNIRGEQHHQQIPHQATEQNVQRAKRSSEKAETNREKTMQRSEKRTEGTYSHEDQSEKNDNEKSSLNVIA